MFEGPKARVSIAQCLLLATTLLATPVSAQLRNPEDAQLRREFEKFSDELEKELEKRQKQASVSRERLQTFREELIEEYKRLMSGQSHGDDEQPSNEQPSNEEASDENSSANEAELEVVSETQRRQRINLIRLELWELERIEPNLESSIASVADLQQKFSKFVIEQQRNGRAANNPVLRHQIQQLYQKIIDIGRRQRTSRTRATYPVGFYVVDPINPSPDESADQPDRLDRVASENDWATGPIQSVRGPLQRILKLQWAGERIEIDRNHWDELFGGNDLDAISKIVRNQLANHGVELPPNERFGGKVVRLEPKSLSLLFENMQHRAAKEKRAVRAVRYNPAQRKMEFSTDILTAYLAVDPTEMEIELRERESPRRSLRFSTLADGRLRIVILGEQTFLLEQKKSGRVVFFRDDGKQVENQIADSFVDLYASNTELLETTIFPFLEHFGMLVPPTRYSEQVIARVIDRIRDREGTSEREFKQLLTELDADEYQVREAASARIKKHANRYVEFAKRAMDEETLSLEVTARLKRIIDAYEDHGVALNPLVEQLGLLEDADYLRSILDKVSPEDVSRVEDAIRVATTTD